MHLTVRDAAKLLRTPEKQIYNWIEEGELPCYWVSDQARFNRTELLEWATARRIPVSVELFRDDDEKDKLPSLGQALRVGGVHYGIVGNNREEVLRAVVALMKLPGDLDRDTLLDVLLAREAAGSTAVGDGIAIPHVRQPVAFNEAVASVALCFLEKPVDYGAADGKPIHILFTIVSPTIHVHLQLLAKLATALHDPGFKAAVLRHAPADEILRELGRVEESFPAAAH